VVGAKAYNLAKLRATLPDWVRVPSSVALPFGVFEAVLKHPANAGPAGQLQQLQAELGKATVGVMRAFGMLELFVLLELYCEVYLSVRLCSSTQPMQEQGLSCSNYRQT
jgi:hypothetical protein